jgi:hypothetical protein
MSKTMRNFVGAALGLTNLCLGLLSFFNSQWAGVIVLVMLPLVTFHMYLLFQMWRENRAEKRGKQKVALYSPAEWTAAFEPAFAMEYPRWAEFMASNTPGSVRAAGIKAQLAKQWHQLVPTTLRANLAEDSAKNAKSEAFGVIMAFKHNHLPQFKQLREGSTLHVLYRNWEEDWEEPLAATEELVRNPTIPPRPQTS